MNANSSGAILAAVVNIDSGTGQVTNDLIVYSAAGVQASLAANGLTVGPPQGQASQTLIGRIGDGGHVVAALTNFTPGTGMGVSQLFLLTPSPSS